MALTVRGLVAQRDLDVRIVAGVAERAGDRTEADRPITWVHISELDDPTPFLSGGELLLTTGLFIRDGLDLHGYVDRLRGVGVLGLGFGIGLSFAQVPGDLVAAADRLGLPLLEVARPTPFIALSRAVSNALAADEYAAVTRTFTAQQELTRAALSPESPARLVRLLARKVDGWVALLDDRGAPVAVNGQRAEAMVPAVAVEVARLREHRGSVGAGFEIDGDSVSLQPVGAGVRRRGYLAVGRPGPLPAADRHLVNAAVMLLTLGFEQDTTRPDGAAGVRSAVLELAFAGQVPLARSVAGRVDATFPDDPVLVLVAKPRADAAPLPPIDPSVLAAELDGELVLVVPPGAAQALAKDLAEVGRTVGSSDPMPADRLAAAREQARRAAEAAADRGVSTLDFDDIGTVGITSLWEPERAAAFAESLLAPLTEHDRTGRGDLVASLRGWLAHHGQWDPAAAALGVHRHTLRRRMSLAGQLLDRDLDSPTVRSELWLALQMMGD